MDKSVLLEKRKNLITSNKGAPELFLNSGFTDVLSLFAYDELLNFIENLAVTQLVLNKKNMLDNIKNVILDVKDLEHMDKVLELLGFPDFKYSKDNDLDKIKTNLIHKLGTTRTDIVDNLLAGSLESKVKYYDTSIWTYFLSYGFLEGVVSYVGNEDLVVRAPLINIEVEIIRNDDGEIIIRKIDNEQVANEILELSLNMQLDKITSLVQAIGKEFFVANEYFNYVAAAISNVDIDAQPSDFTKVSRESIAAGNAPLHIKKSFCICSINPIGGKMLRDYDEVVSSDYQFPIYDTIFHKDLNHLIYDQDQIYQINNPLNLIQKLSIVNAINKNVLVYGPPGTGKSEIVANLIANLLMENKNALIISEKKAALDVLEQRLLSLSALSMSAFDEKNSDVFYRKIVHLNHLIVSTNKVSILTNNENFLTLLKYQKMLQKIFTHKDINDGDITYFVQKYNNINLTLYKRNIDTIKFIYNKLAVDKIKLAPFVKNIEALREIQSYLDSVFGADKINNDAINHKRVKEFLLVLDNITEKDKTFVIRKFLTDNEILRKKPIFQMRNKLDETLDVDKFITMFHKIVDEEIYFVVNNRKIFTFINESINYEDYISLYDWVSNTEWQQFVDIFNNGDNSQTLIKTYWNHQILHTKKADELIRDFYINHLKTKLLGNHDIEIKWTELVRKANLSNRPNINKIIKEYYDILKIVFPIWVLSPDATATIVPLKQNEFDYGIFDEASQMRIEKGLPLIYRCRFAMVSGDDKQLKPTSFFERAHALDETFDGHLDNVDSLLDKAKSSNWMSFTLSNHYRSVNEQLIKYSSHHFYSDQLICITKNGNFKKAIEVVEENGIYDRENGTNPTEANKVIQYLLTTLNQYKTMIVITFNVKQAELIQQQIMNKPELASKLEDLTLKVRSLENVQGDEADLVLISCTFGKDNSGRFIQNFGPVNQDGGMNRINVMITRAKDKMVVIKSFKSEDITNITNQNTNIFKGFLSYVEQIQASNPATEQNEISVANNHPIIDSLCEQLKNHSEWVVEKYKRVGSYTMDLTISKVGSTKVSLCVLLDDEMQIRQYANDSHQWVQHIDRQKYYEDRGYHTYRINAVEWYINPLKLVHKIQADII